MKRLVDLYIDVTTRVMVTVPVSAIIGGNLGIVYGEYPNDLVNGSFGIMSGVIAGVMLPFAIPLAVGLIPAIIYKDMCSNNSKNKEKLQ